MCSSTSAARDTTARAADVAAQLTRAIDECAEAARRPGSAAEPDLAGRLAAMWAILTDADPELAACTARYAGS
jgi:2-oxo-4-hydroxy-4-carboxy--5-ureidoimidazoline (OHCU) decarboxylase